MTNIDIIQEIGSILNYLPLKIELAARNGHPECPPDTYGGVLITSACEAFQQIQEILPEEVSGVFLSNLYFFPIFELKVTEDSPRINRLSGLAALVYESQSYQAQLSSTPKATYPLIEIQGAVREEIFPNLLIPAILGDSYGGNTFVLLQPNSLVIPNQLMIIPNPRNQTIMNLYSEI